MSNSINQQILFKGRPVGEPKRVISALVEPLSQNQEKTKFSTARFTYLFTYMRINLGARIPLVGSHYNAENPPPGPNLMPLLVKHALIKGFLVGDYQHRQAEFINDVSRWLQEGKLKYKEDVVEGLETLSRHRFTARENFGKLIVKVSDDPTR